MRLSQPALKITVAVLLGSKTSVVAAPASSSRSLVSREGSPPPDPKDDKLPKGDAKNLISWTDDDYADTDYKSAPDYDPDQDKDFDAKKRSIDVSLFVRAKDPTKRTTKWLRSVGVDGMHHSDRSTFVGHVFFESLIGRLTRL